MNTIKIYLAESGEVADLKKDFPLYQGQFQNKLLNIYVPTSVLAPEFTSTGVTIGSFYNIPARDYVASTAVKIGMTYTARNGTKKTSKNYNVRFLKTLTYQNVEYALYERKLPQEFTFYAGQGENAPKLVINAVNIDEETDEIISILTSQICYLDVMPSTNLDRDEAIEPSELDSINAQINSINFVLPNKQNKSDTALNTTNKTVVGAINENKDSIDANAVQIQQNSLRISLNAQEIQNLKNSIIGVENYVGQTSGTELPTQADLTNFVVQTAGRQPQNADVVIFVLEIQDATDKNYKYIYSDAGWNGYEIPPAELAGNDNYGLIKGNLVELGETPPSIQLDIVGGEVVNIYVKIRQNNLDTVYALPTYLQNYSNRINNIISGDTSVGLALKAISDENGSNITETYLTKTLGADKTYVRDYAMPREFNDVYFIASSGYVESVPTTPESGVQFTTTTNAVGDFVLFDIQRTNTADFELSSKNGSSNTIYVSADVDTSVAFRLTTQYKKSGGEWQTLYVELTNNRSLIAGEVEKVEFGNPFTALGGDVVNMTDGDSFRQILEVSTLTSTQTVFNVYSNEIYPSIFYLSSQAYVLSASNASLGEMIFLGGDGIIVSNSVRFSVQNADNYEEFLTNQREFLLTANLPIVGTLDDDLEVFIEFGNTTYDVFSFITGSGVRVTIGDLKSVMSYSDISGFHFFAKLLYMQNSDFVGFVLEPNNITAAQLKNIIADSDTVTVSVDGTKLKFASAGGSGNPDGESITQNANNQLQAVALKDRAVDVSDNENAVYNFTGIVSLTEEQYRVLAINGSIIVGDKTYLYDNGTIYITPNTLSELTLTESGTMLISDTAFTSHIHVMIEFETDGVHYGADFILHPYDTSICLVSYRFATYDGTAYLDEAGRVNISIPSGLTFTNVKAHYINLGV